jgi:hypothetical protein
MTWKNFLGFSALSIVALFGIFGVITELLSYASTPYGWDGGRNGTLNGNVVAVSDSTASVS